MHLLSRPAVKWYFALFAIFTAIGIFFTFHMYLGDDTQGSLSFRFHLLDEMTGAWSAMVLVPFLAWVAAHYPPRRGKIGQLIAANIVAMILYTLAHTTIETIMRSAFQGLLGIHETYNLARAYVQEAAGDVVFYTMIMASIYLIYHLIASRKLEAQLAEAQLENLRLQLQPHFLFNALNAISNVMYEDPAKADRMLAQVSDYMRRVLASSGVQEIALNEELAMEQMYVDIMKTRLERGLSLEVRVEDDARNTLVPFMLLQPLLENSIRHGMGSARQTLDLGIAVTRANGKVTIEVSDDGLGYDAPGRSGIGLTNVRERLERLYGSKASFDIGKRSEGGTLAVVTLPFHQGGPQ